jgi:hypothetical protein
MDTPLTPLEQFDIALDKQDALLKILRADLHDFLDIESDSQSWRRNYIRVSASFIEGYIHSLKELCTMSFQYTPPTKISSKENKALHNEKGLDATERVKLTLRAAYKLYELQPVPDFYGPEWERAHRVINQRNLIIHPKGPDDLDIPDHLWSELDDGITWIITQLCNFNSALVNKYGSEGKEEL